jgi:TPR repeat protein
MEPWTLYRSNINDEGNGMLRTKRQAFDSIHRGVSRKRIVDAYAFLLRAILRGDGGAMDGLGSMLNYGVGVEKDARLAAACYMAASRAGYVGATYNLAGALIEGHGIPKDIPKGNLVGVGISPEHIR